MPLASVTATSSNLGLVGRQLEAGPPPLAMRTDVEMPADSVPKEQSHNPPPPPPPPPTKDAKDAAAPPAPPPRKPGEMSGYALTAVLRPLESPAPYKSAEVNLAAIEAARKKTDGRLSIELSQTRGRIVLLSSGFALPAESELRARIDRYGQVLLLPGDARYRIAAPGALRALLGERRLDVAPLSSAAIAAGVEGTKRVGYPTTRFVVTTRAAKATFELAEIKDSGDGGTLLLPSVPRPHQRCAADAALRERSGAPPRGAPLGDAGRPGVRRGERHEAEQIFRRTSWRPRRRIEPSPRRPWRTTRARILLSKSELASFRTAAVESAGAAGDAQAPAAGGLLLVNSADVLRVATLDGVPVAWLAPGVEESLTSLVHGRYVFEWRTFLGEADAPQTIAVPGSTEQGDAGP